MVSIIRTSGRDILYSLRDQSFHSIDQLRSISIESRWNHTTKNINVTKCADLAINFLFNNKEIGNFVFFYIDNIFLQESTSIVNHKKSQKNILNIGISLNYKVNILLIKQLKFLDGFHNMYIFDIKHINNDLFKIIDNKSAFLIGSKKSIEFEKLNDILLTKVDKNMPFNYYIFHIMNNWIISGLWENKIFIRSIGGFSDEMIGFEILYKNGYLNIVDI